MSRRHAKSNLESGSDSFLDIIANIVGILIILIVIAGVRVSQMPATLEVESASAPVAPAPQPVPEEIEAEPVRAIVVSLGMDSDVPSADILPPEPPPPVKVVELPPEPPRPPQPSPELLVDITRLEKEIDNLDRETAKLTPQLAETILARKEAAAAVAKTDRQLEELQPSMNRLEAQLTARKKDIADDMTHLALLADEIKSRSTAEPEVKEIIHKLTPISQIVEGEEFHFHLENNRISYIPLKRLISELKTHLEHRRSLLSRTRTHQGHVGPIDGYRMRYLVERTPLSVIDELKYGPGMFRVSVSAWQLQATPDVEGETAEEALRVGSRFVEVLKTAPPDTTLTMWVYPDSFGLFRELQTAVHANGFNVAARPLPHGVPIAGSPEGSRSAGQ